MNSAPKAFPKIVTADEWQRAHDEQLAKEKALTHARDALAAERRQLPMVRSRDMRNRFSIIWNWKRPSTPALSGK